MATVVTTELKLRIGSAAGTGATLVATKRETFRTDALQVRKGHLPTQINAAVARLPRNVEKATRPPKATQQSPDCQKGAEQKKLPTSLEEGL
jgi:hypothetical protein